MYINLLNIIYKKSKKPKQQFKNLKKNLNYLKKLGAFFVIKTSNKPRNHVFFTKQTNAIMQWNLYAWGLQLGRLKPHPVEKKFVYNLYLFYQCTSGDLN